MLLLPVVPRTVNTVDHRDLFRSITMHRFALPCRRTVQTVAIIHKPRPTADMEQCPRLRWQIRFCLVFAAEPFPALPDAQTWASQHPRR